VLRLIVGFVAGYVLGAKAGHKRFEQIASLSNKITESKPVKEAAGFVVHKVHDVLPGSDKESVSAPDPAVSAAGTPENPVIIT